jgi:hypothetical protein
MLSTVARRVPGCLRNADDMMIYHYAVCCCAHASQTRTDLDRDGTIDWRELCNHVYRDQHSTAAQPSNDDVADDVTYPSNLQNDSTVTTSSSSSSSSSSNGARSVENESKQEYVV